MHSSASDCNELSIIGEKPWWLYDMTDFPGFTREQIEAGLMVPATWEGVGNDIANRYPKTLEELSDGI